MSSAKQTEQASGITVTPRMVAWFVLVIGAFPIIDINGWRLTAPVFFLLLAWVAIVWTGFAVWKAGAAAAARGTGTGDVGFDAGSHQDLLQQEKRLLLKAIKEIEFDREMGKMSEDDAARLTAHYRSEAITVLKELSAAESDTHDARIDAELEALRKVDRATKKKRRKKKGSAPADDGDESRGGSE